MVTKGESLGATGGLISPLIIFLRPQPDIRYGKAILMTEKERDIKVRYSEPL